MEKTETFVIRLTASEKENLRQEAAKKNTIMSLLVRQKLYEYEKLEQIVIEQDKEIQRLTKLLKSK